VALENGRTLLYDAALATRKSLLPHRFPAWLSVSFHAERFNSIFQQQTIKEEI